MYNQFTPVNFNVLTPPCTVRPLVWQVSDVNATFLATEVLPIVESHWNISADP
jgi:hypothetical protein